MKQQHSETATRRNEWTRTIISTRSQARTFTFTPRNLNPLNKLFNLLHAWLNRIDHTSLKNKRLEPIVPFLAKTLSWWIWIRNYYRSEHISMVYCLQGHRRTINIFHLIFQTFHFYLWHDFRQKNFKRVFKCHGSCVSFLTVYVLASTTSTN